MNAHSRLTTFLSTHRVVALDTSPFIYHLQSHPAYVEAVRLLFVSIEQGRVSAVTSTVTMLELLVQPYRNDDRPLVDSIYALASRYPNLAWVPPSLEIAERGARLRADHNLRTPDAVQAATAIAMEATGLVTNDATLRRVPGLEVFLFDD